MIDNPSSQYNPAQITQGLGGLNHELGSNEHVWGIGSVGPYPATSMNHANAAASPPATYSSTMLVGNDNLPYLATGPGGHQGIESQRQLDGHPQATPGMTQRVPFALGSPRLEYDAPAITEVPNCGPLGLGQVPLPYNVAGPFRGNPTVVYSGVPVTGDLKDRANCYFQHPGSHVNELRETRSRSGVTKVFIELEFDGPFRGNPTDVYSGVPVTGDLKDRANYYSQHPGSHVNELRETRSRSGVTKMFIELEFDGKM